MSADVAVEAAAEAPSNEFGFMEAREEGGISNLFTGDDEAAADAMEAGADDASQSTAVEPDAAVAAPQIAYRYEMGFRLAAGAIKPLQERHADMCEARGPNVCRIISMRQADSDGDYAYGNLRIAVAANIARDFSKELESSSGSVDAELVSSSIEGEDLSKAIVDTEAKLRARTLLRDRLMEVLRTRKGTVAELVEAERGVAQVNQEIDQARSWLNEMRGRVAFSQMAISYESGARSSGSFSEPIRSAWNSLGSILGSMIAFLMLAFTVLLPIGILVYVGVRVWRWMRRNSSIGSSQAVEENAPGDPAG
ncbi:DUF4349 domain-containing protein [Erythrobacter sp. GH1-10]|uniref:DUF4349 domain-containing protein n=1 Tax=Erythrobacter sp. GH1-10 TaxID=3349334 RepID=UPI003877D56E